MWGRLLRRSIRSAAPYAAPIKACFEGLREERSKRLGVVILERLFVSLALLGPDQDRRVAAAHQDEVRHEPGRDMAAGFERVEIEKTQIRADGRLRRVRLFREADREAPHQLRNCAREAGVKAQPRRFVGGCEQRIDEIRGFFLRRFFRRTDIAARFFRSAPLHGGGVQPLYHRLAERL